MYSNKFVAVLKVDGKVLREKGDNVFIPFGSEYVISLKNLNDRRAVVKIAIDGNDVLNGTGLLLEKYGSNGDSIDFEGFMDDSKSGVRNKFKFIEKTKEISDYRGDNIEDGLIRIEVSFKEKEIHHFNFRDSFDPSRRLGNNNTYDEYFNSSNLTPPISEMCCHTIQSNIDNSKIEYGDGITVNGNKSDQKFVSLSVGKLEKEKTIIIFKLLGYKENKKVMISITTQDKMICETCGKKMNTNNKFCSNCGTALF